MKLKVSSTSSFIALPNSCQLVRSYKASIALQTSPIFGGSTFFAVSWVLSVSERDNKALNALQTPPTCGG